MNYSREEQSKSKDEHLSLSPVLATKRFPRKHFTKRQYKHNETHSKHIDTDELNVIGAKPLNSHIPVPIKFQKEYSSHKYASYQHPNALLQSDVHTTSSSSLTNFKQRVITNSAKATLLSPKRTGITSSNQHSTSEATLKCKQLSTIQNKTESDSNVIPRLHINSKSSEKKERSTDKFDRIELKCASGDSEDEHYSNSRDYSVNASKLHNVVRKDLDMIYENKKFEGGSKTTLDSDASPPLSPSSKESFNVISSSGKQRKTFETTQSIKEEEADSQLNYNDTTDESVHNQHINCCVKNKKVKSSFLAKDVQQVDFVLPTLQKQIEGWNQDNPMANTAANSKTGQGFKGFSVEEIQLVEQKYMRCREFLRAMGCMRKKLNPKKGETSKPDASKSVNNVRNDITETCQLDVEKNDESIAVGPNNRVQICIGNNRIQISIKADKKHECTIDNTENALISNNDCSATSKAIDMPSSSNTDDTKWSFSTDTDKNTVRAAKIPKTTNDGFHTASGKLVKVNPQKLCASKRVYSNLDQFDYLNADSSASNNSKVIGIEELTSSGFKSGSGQLVSSKGPLERAEELLKAGDEFQVHGVHRGGSFDNDYKSASGKPTKIALFEDCINMESTSGSTETGSESRTTSTTSGSSSDATKVSPILLCQQHDVVKEVNFPLKDRKILKAKSSLGRKGDSFGCKENIRKTLFLETKQERLYNFAFLNNGGFSSASGKKLNVSPDTFRKAAAKLNDTEFDTGNRPTYDLGGFATATGKTLEVDQAKLTNAANKFNDLDVEPSMSTKSFSHVKFTGFSIALGQKQEVSEEKLNEIATTYDNLDMQQNKNVAMGGFATASGRKLNVDQERLQNASAKFDNLAIATFTMDIANTPNRDNKTKPNESNFGGFSSGTGHELIVSDDIIKAMTAKYQDVEDSNNSIISKTKSAKTVHELIEDAVQSCDKALESLNSSRNKNIATSINAQANKGSAASATPIKPKVTPVTSTVKKRLGMSRTIQIKDISKEKLDRARALFQEEDKDLAITPLKSFCKQIAYSNNTPVRNTYNTGQPCVIDNVTSTPMVQKSEIGFNLNLELAGITPIKSAHSSGRRSSSFENKNNDYDGVLLFREKSCSNFQELQNDIEAEYLQLKRKLEILEERKKALEMQRFAIDQGDPDHTRPRLGCLTIRKENTQHRVKLSDLPAIVANSIEKCIIDSRILEITPRNADKIHFNASKLEKPVILSVDGGKVIPNTHNTIGVTEIKNAFQAMCGVDPKLIPKGWVANHYKWIVWKLAVYEKRFPVIFKGFLNVDNIMQQLKYRYDREIDRVSRPALRKIMEKDDVPNKRIVLCVADIIQICGNKFELCLTDGWYSIRTVIDTLLSQEIYKGKIKIGTKLMIQGAELLDCDGCHPLDVPDHVKLKIGYNNTRRSAWYVELGYYKTSTPFPILLKTIQPEGGQVACVKVFIVRVYPLRYMEECKGVKAWRNAKAEEKRSTDFESERLKDLDKIKSQVYEEFEATLKKLPHQSPKVDAKYISSVTCPRELFQLLEASNDPETIYGMLSNSQRSMIQEYKLNTTAQCQKEVSERISKHVAEMKLTNRVVTPMMKVLVTDALESSLKCMVLNVWRPTEEQTQILQEEACISIYNVGVKRNHELNTIRSTMFNAHDGITNKKCQRQLLPISMTTDAYYKPLFNEFDTVGVIVDMITREHDQEFWLADFAGRLLYIKVVDGPKLCSLLDSAKLGQVVAVCNLIMHLPHSEFGQSMANQYSTLTEYPQHKFLQQGLDLFTSQLNNISKLVAECKSKIESLKAHVNLKSTQSQQDYSLLYKSKTNLLDDAPDENETIPSRLTMMDVAMSLIDTDKLI